MLPSSYVWSAADRPLSIHLSLEVIQRLHLEALEAFKAVPRRGLEVGGLLLGHIAVQDGSTKVSIEEFLPVESEHRSGPSYLLSSSDLEQFQRAATTHPGMVGLYRTQTRSEVLSLSEEDARLCRRFAPAPDGVLLLVQPATGTGAYFLWQDGALVLCHEFPFHFSELVATGVVVGKPAAAVQAPPARAPAPAPFAANRRWLTPLMACLLGFACGAFLWRQFQSPSVPRAAPVAQARASTPGRVTLQVERQGRALHLTWDRNAEPMHDATHAKLYITDGRHNSQLELDSRELKAGALSYWPDTQDVTFRLEVFSDSGTATSALRVVGGRPEAVSVPQTAVQTPPPILSETEKLPPRASPQGSASRVVEEIAKPSPFEPPPQPARVAEPAPPPPAPPVKEAEVRSPPPPAREPAPYVAVSAEPVNGSRLGRVVRKIPLIGRLKRKPQAFVPPKPVHQVRPVLTASEQQSLRTSVPIDVKVYVTEAGRVDYAELLSRGSGGNRPLATAAVYAARQWSFTPARMGDENVPGEMILHFDFRPREIETR
ncbi:MAG: hypothetical protein C5B51_25460 [Terriglobia bacterium]|nr:MAG: hypothetical protein C5B51_25460 [Terriglobia bacterium]